MQYLRRRVYRHRVNLTKGYSSRRTRCPKSRDEIQLEIRSYDFEEKSLYPFLSAISCSRNINTGTSVFVTSVDAITLILR